MKLVTAQVKNFKSIEDSGVVPIEEAATVLVGQNESGKTTFLQALHKARPVEKDVVFDVTEDYPRRLLSQYQRQQKEATAEPAEVVTLTYDLTELEIAKINKDLGFELLKQLRFSVHHKYKGSATVSLPLQQKPYIAHLLANVSMADKKSSKRRLNNPQFVG